MTGAAFNMNGGGGRPPQGYARSATDDVNRLNGPSKVLTATDGQQINLTVNYFSRFNHVIGKLHGHGHVKNRQMNTVTDGPCWPRHHWLQNMIPRTTLKEPYRRISHPVGSDLLHHPHRPFHLVSYPDPDFHSCADGLHHCYVKSGSGKVLYSFLSSFPRMLGNQSDSSYAVIAYLCYNRAIN